MFTNPGSKIKSYAKVLFWIGVVISVLIGISVMAGGAVVSSYSYGGVSAGSVVWNIISGLIVIAIGVVISWISVLALYGFGTLVENSDTLVQLNGGIPSGNKKADKAQMPKIKVQVQPTEAAPVQPVASTKVCPKCGEPVEEDAKFCRNCGEHLD